MIRDAHLGTGISNTAIVDWGALSETQAETEDPDATVMFIGANEGYPMEVDGEDPQLLRPRVGGRVPIARRADDGQLHRRRREPPLLADDPDPARPGARADRRHRQPDHRRGRGGASRRGHGDRPGPGLHARATATATRWRSTAQEQIVRESDGIHLNEVGAALAAEIVLDAIDEDFDL